MAARTRQDLLVALAGRRHGTEDWEAVASAVGLVVGFDNAPLSLAAAECAEHHKAIANEPLAALQARHVKALSAELAELPLPAEEKRLAPADTADASEHDKGEPSRARQQPAADAPDTEVSESWVDVSEDERNPRRISVQGTLLKMMVSISKHKWAHPFKRPVTDKEAPDYRRESSHIFKPQAHCIYPLCMPMVHAH